MPDIDHLLTIVEEQRVKVSNIESVRKTEAAEDVAYYTAMIDAASHDPLDDPDEAAAMLIFLKKRQQESVDSYQSIVNEYL